MDFSNCFHYSARVPTNPSRDPTIPTGRHTPPSTSRRKGMPFMKLPVVSMSIGMMLAIATQAAGQVPSGTKVGTLNCQLAPSVGFIIGAHQPMRCRYTPDGPFPPEFYDGVINTIG